MNDVKIAGSGTISSGEYNLVSISGSGKAIGDITCKLLKVAGAARFEGTINSEEASIAGSCKFLKDVKGNKIKVAGATVIEGNVSCEELRADGDMKILGECNVGTLKFEAEGGTFNNIYGDYIELKSKIGKKTQVNEIEATTIEVRNIEAKRISGENVKVTGKSVIDIIEFKDNLKISDKVTVKQIIKL